MYGCLWRERWHWINAIGLIAPLVLLFSRRLGILLAYSRMLIKQRSDDRIFHLWSLAHTGTLKAHGLKEKMNWVQMEGTHLILMHNMEMRDPKRLLLAFLS